MGHGRFGMAFGQKKIRSSDRSGLLGCTEADPGPIRTGHPRNRALEHFRFDTVESHEPASTSQGYCRYLWERRSFEACCRHQEQCLGKRPHGAGGTPFLRSEKQELKELHDLLRGASSLTPSPRYQSDGESEKTAKETSNRRRPSRRSKR